MLKNKKCKAKNTGQVNNFLRFFINICPYAIMIIPAKTGRSILPVDLVLLRSYYHSMCWGSASIFVKRV